MPYDDERSNSQPIQPEVEGCKSSEPFAHLGLKVKRHFPGPSVAATGPV